MIEMIAPILAQGKWRTLSERQKMAALGNCVPAAGNLP